MVCLLRALPVHDRPGGRGRAWLSSCAICALFLDDYMAPSSNTGAAAPPLGTMTRYRRHQGCKDTGRFFQTYMFGELG